MKNKFLHFFLGRRKILKYLNKMINKYASLTNNKKQKNRTMSFASTIKALHASH
jgi:hypothetical protein